MIEQTMQYTLKTLNLKALLIKQGGTNLHQIYKSYFVTEERDSDL